MFNETKEGIYKEQVRFFAGVADGVVHVTLTDMNHDNIFYDWMENIRGAEMFESALSVMCEKYEEYDWVVRYQGGSNAGHTVYVDGKKYVTHSLPTGVIREDCKSVITHGCVVNPEELIKEIEDLEDMGVDFTDRLYISKDATVITRSHLLQDEANKTKWGSTGKGIGPAYRDKYDRQGIKLGSVVNDVAYSKLAPFITDTRNLLRNAERNGDKILMEGAQAVMLDIDFGTYPYVTSSPCTANYAPQGTGLPLSMFGDSAVVGVVKAYTTRIGTGPFPTEFKDVKRSSLDPSLTEILREAGGEYGAKLVVNMVQPLVVLVEWVGWIWTNYDMLVKSMVLQI
jgi:adenylosuccinate synthase